MKVLSNKSPFWRAWTDRVTLGRGGSSVCKGWQANGRHSLFHRTIWGWLSGRQIAAVTSGRMLVFQGMFFGKKKPTLGDFIRKRT